MGSAALAANQETAPEIPLSQETEFTPGGVPAETDMLDSISPAIHAVVLAMLNREQAVFDASSGAGWEALYNMLSLYGQLDDRSDCLDEEMTLPAETVMDFSTALAPNFEVLGSLPQDLDDRMVYDAGSDSYRMVCGNDDLAEIQLGSAILSMDGTLDVAGSLVYLVDGTDLAQFRATLQPMHNMFGYAVTALELM